MANRAYPNGMRKAFEAAGITKATWESDWPPAVPREGDIWHQPVSGMFFRMIDGNWVSLFQHTPPEERESYTHIPGASPAQDKAVEQLRLWRGLSEWKRIPEDTRLRAEWIHVRFDGHEGMIDRQGRLWMPG